MPPKIRAQLGKTLPELINALDSIAKNEEKSNEKALISLTIDSLKISNLIEYDDNLPEYIYWLEELNKYL